MDFWKETIKNVKLNFSVKSEYLSENKNMKQIINIKHKSNKRHTSSILSKIFHRL